MKRLRLVFALLALALLGAAGLLVQRALGSVEAEEEAQRRTLAERVFDEMESGLSTFLSNEEVVPFQAWLSRPAPDPPFVVARFELGPGDAIRLSPRAPADLAPLLTGWGERRIKVSERDAAPAAAVVEPVAPAPAPQAKAAKESVYDALQSLNRGAESRKQRITKLEAEAPKPASAAAPRAEEFASRELGGKDQANAGAADARHDEVAKRARSSSLDADAGTLGALNLEGQAGRFGQRVVVDPLLGDRLDRERLVLVRTVITGERGQRQGLVLDAAALGEWLRARVLGGDALPGIELAFSTDAAAGEAGAPAGSFTHRFAEPFSALEAVLRLPSLPDAGSADTVLRLSLLLVAAGGLGLFAAYRMVAVALRYAEQRSNFVAAVSHELKTPLTAIRMYGEMLRDGLVPTEEKRKEYYATITAESERLSRLIDNVLEFARAERGERAAVLRPADLGAEVRSLSEVLRPHASGVGFRLDLALGEKLAPVRIDRDALAQILVNLVDNALKYARDAAERVVRIECDAADGGVALRVRDFGPGVPPQQLGQVFELFHRGEDELTRTTRGTGLGLALVRTLAARMGARASARNAEGGGFEVTVLFPRAEAG
jgi:signal transduction histidine kinase